MAAAAADRDVHRVRCRHERPAAEHEGAGRKAGVVVQAEDRVAGKAFEQPVGNHALRATVAARLFGRLEHQVHGAGEIAASGEMPCRAEQHRRVAVMPAGMHGASVPARVRQAGLFDDRQGVHVGAQAHAARAVAALQAAHHAVAADVARDLVAPFGKVAGDQLGRGRFLERQLGMLVQVAADLREEGRGVGQVAELAMGLVACIHEERSFTRRHRVCGRCRGPSTARS